MQYERNYQLQEEYSTWIKSLEWDYFFTGTFQDWDITPNSARRNSERFFGQFETRELAFLFIESGSLYGKVHVHGLLRFDPDRKPPASFIWELWFKRYGRAKVEVIDSREAVSNYCCKYITKQLRDETFIVI